MLELKNINFDVETEGGNVSILKNINLNLDENKIYVITGPNGSGKSSLAKIIMGIYKPTSGNIIFNGEDITNYSITERAKLDIGYAFQQPPTFKGIKVKDLIEIASKKEKNLSETCEVLMDVGLCAQDYMNREVDKSLSGGELKRIEIASVIARELKLAIFDEPEAGIDLWSFQRLAETFKAMHEKKDTTLVIISHQERILNLADKVILMQSGEVKEITDKDKVLSEISRADDACKCSASCEKGAGKNVKCDR